MPNANSQGNESCTAILNKQKELICFMDAENQKSCRVHVYHFACLAKHISGTESLSCLLCKPKLMSSYLNQYAQYPLKIGIDVGGVIITSSDKEDNVREDTSFFGSNYRQTPQEEGAFEGIASLVTSLGPSNVFIVSKCGPEIQKKTLEWLEHHKFFELTGMLRQNVYFVITRPEKAIIAKQLNLTHFVDDRTDVLIHLRKVESIRKMFLFHPNETSKQHCMYYMPGMNRVQKWKEVSELVMQEANQKSAL